MNTNKKKAKLAGFLYLIYFVIHIFADVFGRSGIIMLGDAVATTQNIGHRPNGSLHYLADDIYSVLPFSEFQCNNLYKLSAWIYCGIWAYFVASD